MRRLGLLLLLLAACRSAPPEPGGSQSAKPNATEDAPSSALGFVERTTMNASASEKLPMIVAIHGMGDRPENFLPAFEHFPVKARVIAPRAPRKYGSGYSWFTYPPKSEALASQEILEAARLVAEGIRAWSKAKPTSGKAIVTGFSQGGFLTFALAVHFPDDLGAAFPISGGLPAPLVPEKADAAAAPPIFAMHGDADAIVPIAMARTPVERLKSMGFRVELKEYPRVEHTVNAAMWGELEKRIEKALSD